MCSTPAARAARNRSTTIFRESGTTRSWTRAHGGPERPDRAGEAALHDRTSFLSPSKSLVVMADAGGVPR